MKFAAFNDLTRLKFTLFNLPFTLAGAFLPLAAKTSSGHWMNMLWILPAFFMARLSGMAFNQLIDREIDAQNERTKNRPIPSGRVSPRQAATVAWSSLLIFVLICYQINFLCFLLAPVAAFLIFIYSYLKRIHASCHFILGCIQLMGPVMAYGAITGTLSTAPLFLGLTALLTISANDIVYAIQDHTVDCEQGLNSIPAKFGISMGLNLAAALHALAAVALLFVGMYAHLPPVYYVTIPVVGGVLVFFHVNLRAQYNATAAVAGLERLFFFSNIAVSLSALLGIGLSAVWRVLL